MGVENSNRAAWGITVLRMVVGLVFVLHGWQKLTVYGLGGVEQMLSGMGVPFAGANAVLVTFVELLGGLALLVGAFTRLAAIPVAFTMVVAIFTAHLSKGFFAQDGGFEYPFVLLAATIALALTGPGALAVDNLLARRRAGSAFGAPRPATA